MKKKIVVLGGFGFLGKHVISLLKKKNYLSIPLSRRNHCDITKLSSFVKILKKYNPDVIINCAAHVGSVHYALRFAADMIYDNMQIILNIYEGVLKACPKAKIINPISNCSYPGDANIHSEPDWERGSVHESVLAYASTRRMIYALAECYRKQYQIRSINWLISNAYGPGDYTDPNKVHALNGIIIRLIKSQRKGDNIFEIWGSGKPLREWVYIGDVAKILVDSIRLEEQTYPLNFAQNKAYSIAEIAKLGAKQLNYNTKFVFNKKYPDGAMIKILDDRQFRTKYPTFRFTAINIGIKKTTEYYKKIL